MRHSADNNTIKFHDFTRASGYVVNDANERFSDHAKALNHATEKGYNKAIILNDADINYHKWYYVADHNGQWQQVTRTQFSSNS